MIKQRHTGEIYLISLDTFMIMTIIGFIVGMILMVVNPLLNPSNLLPPAEGIDYDLDNEAVFRECLNISDDVDFGDIRIDTEMTLHYQITTGENKTNVFVQMSKNNEFITDAQLIQATLKTNNCLKNYLTNPVPQLK